MLHGMPIVVIRMVLWFSGYGRMDYVSIDEWRPIYSNLRTTTRQMNRGIPHEALLFWALEQIERQLSGCPYEKLSDAFKVLTRMWIGSAADQRKSVGEIGDLLMRMPQTKMRYDGDLLRIVNHMHWKILVYSTPFQDHAGLLFSTVDRV
jgi:hypothetical protein